LPDLKFGAAGVEWVVIQAGHHRCRRQLQGNSVLRRPITLAPAVALIAAFLTVAGTASPASADSVQPTLHERGKIVKVVDGDTVDVRLRGGDEKRVRLLGIDTPEVYGTIECGGPEASRSLKRLLSLGTRVRLVSDPTQDRVDRYGRILRYVIKVSDDRDMNRVQVRKGWATVYVYNHNPFKRVADYRSAQSFAGARDRGIWGTC
jgi:endonuclease YncB( thermonuclease family)